MVDEIKDILENSFPKKIDPIGNTSNNTCPEQLYSGKFSLSDTIACNSCTELHPGVVPCDRKVLEINSDSEVHVLYFDKYVTSFHKDFHQRCDYIVYDTGEKYRIAFCELTCSSQKNVESYLSEDGMNHDGKRAKAYGQIRETIEALLSINVLDQSILTYPSKIGLFGWRERKASEDGFVDRAMASMSEFTDTPDSEEPVLFTKEFVLQHDFIFVQVKYPYVFHWNETIISRVP